MFPLRCVAITRLSDPRVPRAVPRTLEVHDLMLCCYYSAKRNPFTDWSDLAL